MNFYDHVGDKLEFLLEKDNGVQTAQESVNEVVLSGGQLTEYQAEPKLL